MKRIIGSCLVLLLALAGVNAAWAQGVQTGTLVGTVLLADGQPVEGATVTATSPALIGERSTLSGANGDYIIRNLTPGAYSVVFTLDGMQSVSRTATLGLGATSRVDATLEVSSATETIEVQGESPSALETPTVGGNYKASTIETLPLPARTPFAIAELTGGLTDNGTVAGQLTISGAFAYDNIFMINGVDVNDNAFGTPNDLFIEDAIQETQVLTSGISAEYGRFSGGVVNAITKSGGDDFSGSLRADFTRPEWREETDFEKVRNQEREGDLGKIYTATLGGPIIKEHAWFFLAGRDTEQEIVYNLPGSQTTGNNPRAVERYEGKLTANIADAHTIFGSYIQNERTDGFEVQVTPLEQRAVGTGSSRPNEGYVFGYSGVFTKDLFGELRYSQKDFGFRGLGGTETDIFRSPIRNTRPGSFPGSLAGTFNAPYFDATDPEDRNNEQLYASMSYFVSSDRAGSHDIKLGFEDFTDIRTGGNSQTATGFVFYTGYAVSGGRAALDSQGRYVPIFRPNVSRIGNWIATRGVELDIKTQSLFINDRWNLNDKWTFNIGARYEQIDSETDGGVHTLDSSALVPRLGASWDVLGNGKYKVDVTYSQYAGRYLPGQFGNNNSVGNPGLLYGIYQGPLGQGADFAPGFNPANYLFYYVSAPTANVIQEDDLSSPITDEITLQGGMALNNGGYLKLIYTTREVTNFVEDFIDTTTGLSDVTLGGINAGLAENIVYRNSDVPTREYEAIQLQGSYNVMSNWSVSGSWTHQIKNEGNFEGEAGQSPAISSTFGNFPEIFDAAHNFPIGRNDDYQEHKVRVWTNYRLGMGAFGALDLGMIFRYDSPLTFSFSSAGVPLSQQQLNSDPGYILLPFDQTLFYGGTRGTEEYDAITTFDVSLRYEIPILQMIEPYIKFDVTNVLNDNGLNTFNTTVTPNNAGPKDARGLPTTFIKGANFGLPTNAASYQTPREYFFAAGIRF